MSSILSKQIADSSVKLPVRAVTTAALPSNTYNNGLSGVGATLTGTALSPLPPIDGVPLNVGDRLLVMNEAAAANNGIYSVTNLGSGSSVYVLTRTDDCNNIKKVFSGISVMSGSNGTLKPLNVWVLNAPTVLVLGTTALNFYPSNRVDIQSRVSTAPYNVRSSSYIAVNNTLLNTHSLNSSGTYVINFNAVWNYQGVDNVNISFLLSIGGVNQINTTVSLPPYANAATLAGNGTNMQTTIMFTASGLSAGTAIQAMINTNGSPTSPFVNILSTNMNIQGYPTPNII